MSEPDWVHKFRETEAKLRAQGFTVDPGILDESLKLRAETTFLKAQLALCEAEIARVRKIERAAVEYLDNEDPDADAFLLGRMQMAVEARA
jgi:hypothetical protein